MSIQPVHLHPRQRHALRRGLRDQVRERWRAKGGVEDLKKARHFLDLLIEAEQSAQARSES